MKPEGKVRTPDSRYMGVFEGEKKSMKRELKNARAFGRTYGTEISGFFVLDIKSLI